MKDEESRVLVLLEQMMDRSERLERQLTEAEEKRARKGTYERYERRMLRVAKGLDREALELLMARQATELQRARKETEIQVAHVRATSDWLDYESTVGHVEQSEQIRNLSAKPAVYGRLARDARWAGHDKIKAFVLQRWAERPWRSKAEFARVIAPDVEKLGKEIGIRLSADNIERTIRGWVTDKSSGTSRR